MLREVSSVVIPFIDFLVVNLNAVLLYNLIVPVVVSPSDVLQKLGSLVEKVLNLSEDHNVSLLFLLELNY